MAAKKTPKIIRCLIKDKLELETMVRDTVIAQLEREELISTRDQELAVVSAEHNPRIDAHSDLIASNMLVIEQWADAHPDEFGEARSILVEGHRIGFRLGQPKPEPIGKMTWKAIVNILRRWMTAAETFDSSVANHLAPSESLAHEGALAAKFLRLKYEPNKEAMLENHRLNTPEALQELAEISVEITQSEEFYLDPAREGQPDKRLSNPAKEAA